MAGLKIERAVSEQASSDDEGLVRRWLEARVAALYRDDAVRVERRTIQFEAREWNEPAWWAEIVYRLEREP